ncbi:MAG: hypothetical protein M0036_04630 [Desulfobacteraceae bacterium]|nr:hypothetical protein [Desulfobacteraceae bacterium]
MRTKRLSIILILMVFLLSLATGAWAYSTKYKLMGFSGTAGEVLVTGDVVCIADADGLIYKADANDATRRPAVGIVGLQARAIGDKVEVITHGILRGWTSLSEGASGYLSETAGAVTQSTPTYSQKIGLAISTTEYLINCQEYIDTSALTALGVLAGATPIILEGATADDYETTIAPTDPTADRTLSLPDRSGRFALDTAAVTASTTSPVTVTTTSLGQTLTNTGAGGAVLFNLPEASTWIGGTLDFAVGAAQNLDINPDNADQILGLTNAVGDAIRNATVGGTIRLKAVDATNIVVVSSYGTWSDAN